MLVTCEVCEREVEADVALVWDDDDEVHYFCSEACYEELGEDAPIDAGYEEDVEVEA